MSDKNGKVLYTGKTRTVGVLEVHSQSTDGRLDIRQSALGSKGTGTNPEQLLAAGWSACFILAMNLAASRLRVTLPEETAVDAEVDLCNTLGNYDGAFFIKARLNVSLPGLDREIAQQVMDAAHDICPYHQATRHNVEVSAILV